MATSIPSQLRSLGFTENEIAVYTACLTLGTSRAGDIVHKSKLARGTVYLTLERLQQRGLITEHQFAGTKHFTVEPPEVLGHHFTEQAQTAQELVPDLWKLYSDPSRATNVKLYRGLESIKQLYDSLLELGFKHYKVIGSQEHWDRADEKWFDGFAKRRHTAGITVDIILEQSPAAEVVRKRKQLGRTAKIMPKKYMNQFITSDCAIFPDRILFMNYGREMTAVQLESKEAAALMNALFDMAWDGISK